FGKREETDPRNDLFVSYLRCIQALSPRYFVMENVPGLSMMYEGRAVREIYRLVAAMKPTRYEIAGPIKINAADFGVPQTRERILFIGFREDVPPIEEIPPTYRRNPVTVRDAIGDLAFLRAWERNGHYDPDHPATTNYQKESRRGR